MRRLLAATVILAAWAGPAWADRADRRLLEQSLANAGMAADAAEETAELLDEIFETIADHYVRPLDPHDLARRAAGILAQAPAADSPAAVAAAMKAVAADLDPHTSYLSPSEWKAMASAVSGRFSGVGMELTMKDGAVTVVAPIDGSPASRAGIKPDDQVIGVDGKSVGGLTLLQVVERIRGPKGKAVLLELRDPGGAERRVSVIRDSIRLQPVKGRLDGDVAYVRISQFTGGVSQQLAEELKALDRQAAFGVKGIVLDLRRNPGGLLDEAVKVADLFLDDVPIVSTRGRDPRDDDHENGRRGQILAGAPMAVLIDGGSASASEIVAGALHDNNRAALVGVKSYGKGSVQMLREVSQGAVRVTAARYFRPNDQPVDGVGLIPNLPVPAQEGADHQLLRALDWVRRIR